ncbi:MAG TPA: PASTA domain-containing protein [Acidimicrobiales bacterium]|nr:PASTA domain-containing protein [Acidimicrobiales bacterium]
MADLGETKATPGARRRAAVVVAALALIAAIGVGFAVGRVTAPGTSQPHHGAQDGTTVHFFENAASTTTSTTSTTSTTTLLPTTTTTVPPTTTTTAVPTAVVPDAVALDRQSGVGAEALTLLKQAGFNYTFSYQEVGQGGNCGVYMAQSPTAGSRAPVGSTVVVTVAQC